MLVDVMKMDEKQTWERVDIEESDPDACSVDHECQNVLDTQGIGSPSCVVGAGSGPCHTVVTQRSSGVGARACW